MRSALFCMLPHIMYVKLSPLTESDTASCETSSSATSSSLNALNPPGAPYLGPVGLLLKVFVVSAVELF